MEAVVNKSFTENISKKLKSLKSDNLYLKDFFNTWDKTGDELEIVLTVADALKLLRGSNISTKIFDSGLGVSIFRDQSTRTRFSFSSACNLLGLQVQDFDEGKSQVAHGETVRETAVMISFMADIIGIRDDMYIGKGAAFMNEVSAALDEGYKKEVLPQRPTIINLQSDVDHPTQSMADLLHLINHFGGIENLKGKKLAMTWAYSPAYGKPLSVPQAVIGLMTRFKMDVVLAHPEGYEIMPEVENIAEKNAKNYGGSFKKSNDMKEAFLNADIVYPKSWAPFEAMKERSLLFEKNDAESISKLECELLKQNVEHQNWTCNRESMNITKDKNTLYMHCLPADITGVSCEKGEVDKDVFEKYRVPLYKEASYKPYIIAAMILLSRFPDGNNILNNLQKDKYNRVKYI